MKRFLFSLFRRRILLNKVANIFNYLDNMEVVEGLVPTGKRVLVLAPHPDDESIGCGGIISLMVQAKSTVDVAFVTRGEKVEADEDRSEEQLRAERAASLVDACDLLGVRERYFLGANDGQLHLQPMVERAVRQLLDDNKYEVVFCPWPYDSHSDHAKTFSALALALKRASVAPQIWMYEVWNPLPANRVISIDSVIQQKSDAIGCYTREVEQKKYDEVAMGLARYRSLLCKKSQFAEAFLVGDTQFTLTLAGAVEGSVRKVREFLACRLVATSRT